MEPSQPRLRELSTPARVLATCFLLTMGVGFVAAQVNNQLTHADRDGEPGLSVADVVIAFYGKEGSTTLTSKIGPGGSMAKYIPRPADLEVVRSWVASGAEQDGFADTAAVLDRLCVRCHNPQGEMAQAAFAESRAVGASYDLVAPFTAPDTGMSYSALARSSHAHLFGMGVLYALAGLVFLMTDLRARAKSLLIALPFAAMALDIGSWWLTKLHPGFAWGVIVGGSTLGVAFAILVLLPLWEMWGPPRRRTGAGSEISA